MEMHSIYTLGVPYGSKSTWKNFRWQKIDGITVSLSSNRDHPTFKERFSEI